MDREERFYSTKKGFSLSGDVVESVKKQIGLNDKILALPKILERELGALSKSVELAGIKNNTIYLDVSSSSHFQEVLLRKKQLINRINQHFGKEKVVRNIKIQIQNEK